MIIRKAQIGDLKKINEVVWQVHEYHVVLRPDIYISNEEIITEEFFEELQRRGEVLVVEEGEAIIAYAVCLFVDWNNPLMVKKKVLLIDAIGVLEEYKRQGVGRELFTYIKIYAYQAEFDKIELQVNYGNKSAMNFYKEMGMHERMLILEMDLD